MKYIPGTVFTVKKPKLLGQVSQFFVPGKIYQIYNISMKDGKVVYTFTGGFNAKRFEMQFDDKKQAENTIDYLLNILRQ